MRYWREGEGHECPHCGVNTTGQVISRADSRLPDDRLSLGRVEGDPEERAPWNEHVVIRCTRCEKDTYLLVEKETKMVAHQHPLPAIQLPATVPALVALAHREAGQALEGGLTHASAVMSRRGVEALCDHQGANGNDLRKKILDLEAKQTFPPILKTIADDIRRGGNVGAHADPLTLSYAEAEQLFRFFEDLLGYVYTLPARVARSRFRP